MHLAGGNSDFGAHAEFTTVSKLRRRIVQKNGRVDLIEKQFHDARVFGNHSFGMMRGIVIDMLYRAVDTINKLYRNDRIEIFGRPIFLRGGFATREDLHDSVVTTNFAAS